MVRKKWMEIKIHLFLNIFKIEKRGYYFVNVYVERNSSELYVYLRILIVVNITEFL